jgi:hypothetical protein
MLLIHFIYLTNEIKHGCSRDDRRLSGRRDLGINQWVQGFNLCETKKEDALRRNSKG